MEDNRKRIFPGAQVGVAIALSLFAFSASVCQHFKGSSAYERAMTTSKEMSTASTVILFRITPLGWYAKAHGGQYPSDLKAVGKKEYHLPTWPKNFLKDDEQPMDVVTWGKRSAGDISYWVSGDKNHYCIVAYGADSTSGIDGTGIIAISTDLGSFNYSWPEEPQGDRSKDLLPPDTKGAPNICKNKEPPKT